VHNAHINAQRIVGADQGRTIDVGGGGEHPLTANEYQIDLAFGVFQQLALVFTTEERDALASGERPDRDGILARQEAKDPLIVWLGGVTVETAACLSVPGFQVISDLGDAAHGSLGREAKACAQFGIGQPVQRVLPARMGVVRPPGKPIARGIASLQRGAELLALIRCGQQPDGSSQFHPANVTARTQSSSMASCARPAIPLSPSGDSLSRTCQ